MTIANVKQSLVHKRANDDIARNERRGVIAARLVAIRLRKAILATFKRGDADLRGVNVRAFITSQLHDLMSDAMLVIHLQGMMRSREIYRQQTGRTLSLSIFDATIRQLKKLVNPQRVRELETQYDVVALRVLNGASDKIERGLRKTVSELIQEGAHVREGVSVLHDRFDELGLTAKKDYFLETIFRTQSQLAYNAGRWEADQAPEIQEILWGYEYSATDDDRVRDEHLALDGTRAPKDDAIWARFWPPNGYNCRCQVIPIFEPEPAVYPPRQLDNGEPVAPDEGFDFNMGQILTK